jgi:hypothetical protein
MKRIEVRCCCQPQKLLGTLPVPDQTGLGAMVKFVVMKPRTYAQPRGHNRPLNGDPYIHLPTESYADMTGPHPKYGIALKAEGVSIEQLRLIPGFIEEKA